MLPVQIGIQCGNDRLTGLALVSIYELDEQSKGRSHPHRLHFRQRRSYRLETARFHPNGSHHPLVSIGQR